MNSDIDFNELNETVRCRLHGDDSSRRVVVEAVEDFIFVQCRERGLPDPQKSWWSTPGEVEVFGVKLTADDCDTRTDIRQVVFDRYCHKYAKKTAPAGLPETFWSAQLQGKDLIRFDANNTWELTEFAETTLLSRSCTMGSIFCTTNIEQLGRAIRALREGRGWSNPDAKGGPVGLGVTRAQALEELLKCVDLTKEQP